MQITRVEVIPVELKLRLPYRSAFHPEITQATAIFLRVETQQGLTAWGCTAHDPFLSGEALEDVLRACHACADLARDLNPLNVEYALERLAQVEGVSPPVLCGFDLAFHDLLGLAAGLPLYRLLGGYRSRIQTSATVSLTPLDESVRLAHERARQGFQNHQDQGRFGPRGGRPQGPEHSRSASGPQPLARRRPRVYSRASPRRHEGSGGPARHA